MFLEINDVDISPYIKSLQPSHESIWNSKAGRSIDSEATFVGRIVARKWKLQAKTIPLSQEKVAEIVGLLEQSDFFSAKFIPTNGTDFIKKNFYVGSISTQVYSYNDELSNVRYSELSFDIIER